MKIHRVALVLLLTTATIWAATPATTAWKEIERLLQKGPTSEVASGGGNAPQLMPLQSASAARDEATVGHYTLLKFRVEDFVQKYPDDPRRWEAQALLHQLAPMIAEVLGHTIDYPAVRAGLDEVIGSTAAGKDAKLSAAYGWISVAMLELAVGMKRATYDELLVRMERFATENPRDQRSGKVSYWLGQVLAPNDPEKAMAAYRRAAKSSDEQTAANAETALVVLQGKREPPVLAFTAVDGRKVDLAALRGKVVLVDFWATWCPPCRAEAPNVVAAYEKLHERGFEIVGISFDDDKKKLAEFTTRLRMTWPQYFDGGGWQTKYAGQFKIHSIPTMWLIGRDGRIVTADVRGDLAKQVEKLLAQ